jgi:hypothetical protein
VYNNLSGDLGDPFPFFSRLVGNAYPGTSQIITGQNLDNPFPLGILSFMSDKNTFGKDEVTDIISQGGRVSNAFYVALEGFSINSFNTFNITIPGQSAFGKLQTSHSLMSPGAFNLVSCISFALDLLILSSPRHYCQLFKILKYDTDTEI